MEAGNLLIEHRPSPLQVPDEYCDVLLDFFKLNTSAFHPTMINDADAAIINVNVMHFSTETFKTATKIIMTTIVDLRRIFSFYGPSS